jgi:hypothetical protein
LRLLTSDPFLIEIQTFIRGREAEEPVPFPCYRRLYSAAVFIIRRFLGEAWCSETLFGNRDPYLANTSGPCGDFKFQDRVTSLGELLLNLRRIDGFASRVTDLKTVSLETAVAELDGAQLLASNAIPFRFVKPGGLLKGDDYDVEAIIEERVVACEMKAKLERVAPNWKSVRNTVHQARTQLPKDRAGILFVKVPEAWGASSEGRAALDLGIKRGLSGTGRITFVVAHWERWQLGKDGSAARAVVSKTFGNPCSRHELKSFANAIGSRSSLFLGRQWIRLEHVVCDPQDVLRTEAHGLALSVNAHLNTGRPLPGVGPLYYGSLDGSMLEKRLLTVVDFSCDNFDLFGAQEGKTAEITLRSGALQAFKVCRTNTPTAFQFQLPAGLSNAQALATAVSDVQKAVTWFKTPHEMAAGEPIIRLVRDVFSRLRSEGDLKAQECVVRDLVVWFYDPETRAIAFQASYFGMTFTF